MKNRIVANSQFTGKLFCLLADLLAVGFPAVNFYAEQLPLRHYTSADGLASSAVTNIVRVSARFSLADDARRASGTF